MSVNFNACSNPTSKNIHNVLPFSSIAVLAELPFHSVDDEDFFNCVLFPSNNQPIICHEDIVNNSFQLNNPTDPLNSELNEQETKDCLYYLADEFNEKINEHPIEFSTIHFNSRSMTKNFDQITAYLSSISHNFSAIALTETWLSPDNESLFCLDGYNFVNKNRLTGKGGGVGLFLRNELDYIIRNDLNSDFSTCETVFVEINVPKGQNVIVGVLYRPPKSNVDNYLTYFDSLLKRLSKENKQIYLLGDYNLDLLKVNSNKVLSIMNIISLYGFYVQINIPTRISKTSATLIDNILANTNELQSGVLYSSITDHLPVFCFKKGCSKSYNNQTCTYRKLTPSAIENFKKDLYRADWNECYKSDDVDSAYNSFIALFLDLYNKHFPLVTMKRKKKNKRPWVTKKILKMIKKKNKLYKKFCTSRLASDERKFKIFRNNLITTLRTSKQEYYKSILKMNKNNIKKTWQTINKLLGKKKSTIPSSFNDNGQTYTDPKDIANKFNEYFINIGKLTSHSIPRSVKSFKYYCNIKNVKSFFVSPVLASEILDVSKSLRVNASSGVDDISCKVVKQVIHAIVLPLVHICNLSFVTGKVPLKLKESKVIPVFKNKDPSKFENYRPISILPCFSKILERLMYNRLYRFLTLNNLLSNSQFGFRSKHSCEHVLIKACERILKSFKDKQFIIGVFLDLSKAFDTMDHSILLTKLKLYGVRGVAYEWFSDYLSNRNQHTYLNNVSSETSNITIGVPQGSILGPLLFLLYINDLPKSSNVLSFYQFADDTSIFYSSNNQNHTFTVLNDELANVSDWLKANKLSLNIRKTKWVNFNRNPNRGNSINKNNENSNSEIYDNTINVDSNLYIDNNLITQCSSTNFLGVTINKTLTWKDHIDNILLKTSRNVGLIWRLRNSLHKENLITLYNSLVLPYLNYCNTVWATNAKQSELERVFKIQKKCLRIATHSHYLAPSAPLFSDQSLLNIFDINKLELATFMFKFKNDVLPESFNNLFRLNSQIHNYNTRSSNKFHLWSVTSQNDVQSITHTGPRIWNTIPDNLTQLRFLSAFKREYKFHLLKQYLPP